MIKNPDLKLGTGEMKKPNELKDDYERLIHKLVQEISTKLKTETAHLEPQVRVSAMLSVLQTLLARAICLLPLDAEGFALAYSDSCKILKHLMSQYMGDIEKAGG